MAFYNRKVLFNNKINGFYGTYWENKIKSKSAILCFLGDDANDTMAILGVKYLFSLGINALTMSVDKKSYSYHNFPLEKIKIAIDFLKSEGIEKIGICGASTTGMLSLVAASLFTDLTLTIAMTPSDFVWQGFEQGKKDGQSEWPIENESTLSFEGKPLPYMKFIYQHPEYGKVIKEEAKKYGAITASKKIFDDSEKAYPISEDQFIKVENINGKLLLVGAEDDVLWDTVRYIKRMDERLKSKEHKCDYEVLTFIHGTHFVFPQGMLDLFGKKWLVNLFLKLCFKELKEFPKECKDTRIAIDKAVSKAINEWKI